MLGSVADAEDVVQEAWLRFARSGDQVDNPRAWLTQVTSRLAIDGLRAEKRSREQYPGPWLPTPLIGPVAQDESLELAESISMAFLVMLEQLSPVERAVFLLRAVFERDYEEIATTVGKEPANCRQIFARARKHVDDAGPRFDVPRAEHLAVLAAFSDAARSNDLGGLLAILAPDAVLTSDGGGKIAAALKPVRGAEKVAKFLLGVEQVRAGLGQTTVEPSMVNGRPGAIVRLDGAIDSAVSVEMTAGRIAAIHVVRNPDKLRHLA